MASRPAANARGRRRRQAQSPQAPIAAISGHFTHQVDASRNTTVNGSHLNTSKNAVAARSTERSPSRGSTGNKVAGKPGLA
jgi:hypothetical protein